MTVRRRGAEGALVLLSLLGALACGGDVDVNLISPGAGAAGAGGASGASGGVGASAASGASGGAGGGGGCGEGFVPPENPDEVALEACNLPEPCSEQSYIQLAEQSDYHVWTEGSACLLQALAQRTPGRYLHETDSTWSSGSAGAMHVLVISEGGDILYARTPYEYQWDACDFPPPDPGQRCAPKPPAFFDACRQALLAQRAPGFRPPSPDDPVWACLFGDGDGDTPSHLGWFESCATESPIVCE